MQRHVPPRGDEALPAPLERRVTWQEQGRAKAGPVFAGLPLLEADGADLVSSPEPDPHQFFHWKFLIHQGNCLK